MSALDCSQPEVTRTMKERLTSLTRAVIFQQPALGNETGVAHVALPVNPVAEPRFTRSTRSAGEAASSLCPLTLSGPSTCAANQNSFVQIEPSGATGSAGKPDPGAKTPSAGSDVQRKPLPCQRGLGTRPGGGPSPFGSVAGQLSDVAGGIVRRSGVDGRQPEHQPE